MIMLPVLVSCLKQQVFTIGFIFALFNFDFTFFPLRIDASFQKMRNFSFVPSVWEMKGGRLSLWGKSSVECLSFSLLSLGGTCYDGKKGKKRKKASWFLWRPRGRGGVGSLDDMLLADVLDP